jgi:hypothetical protein
MPIKGFDEIIFNDIAERWADDQASMLDFIK